MSIAWVLEYILGVWGLSRAPGNGLARISFPRQTLCIVISDVAKALGLGPSVRGSATV